MINLEEEEETTPNPPPAEKSFADFGLFKFLSFAKDKVLTNASQGPASYVEQLDTKFGQGRFSDICVTCFYKTYKLHRIILLQSPFFNLLLAKDNACSDIFLETGNDPRISQEGLEIALRDLYEMHGTSIRDSLINTENASFVLAAACFLELTDLADFCTDFILTGMTFQSISSFIQQLDRLSPTEAFPSHSSYGPDHKYVSLLRDHYLVLEKSCLSYLCQMVSALGFESTNDKLQHLQGKPPRRRTETVFQWKTAEPFLASLPISWVKRIMESNILCIESEYARYSSLKSIFIYRDQLKDVKIEEAEALILEEEASFLPSQKDSFPTTLHTIPEEAEVTYKSYLGNLIESVLPAKKKRKREDCDTTTEPVQIHKSNSSRALSRSGSRIQLAYDAEKEIRTSMVRDSIFYTHMTFEQLQSCKRDAFVPDSVILQSFWDQTEFSHGYVSRPMPLFRFAVNFLNTGELFAESVCGGPGDDKRNGKTICSEPIMCAGAQYRVILCREDAKVTPEDIGPIITIEDDESDASTAAGNSSARTKPIVRALLQRTRPTISNAAATQSRSEISYSIYAFDRNAFNRGKIQDAAFFDAFTICNFDGSGHAKSLPLCMFNEGDDAGNSKKSRSKDGCCDFWTMVVIQFNRGREH